MFYIIRIKSKEMDMENCEKYITLKNLDIKAELMFDMVLSLRYEFVLKN